MAVYKNISLLVFKLDLPDQDCSAKGKGFCKGLFPFLLCFCCDEIYIYIYLILTLILTLTLALTLTLTSKLSQIQIQIQIHRHCGSSCWKSSCGTVSRIGWREIRSQYDAMEYERLCFGEFWFDFDLIHLFRFFWDDF